MIMASGNLVVSPASITDTGSEVKVFTIVVGRTGFNGSSGALNIQVNQGDRVRIIFVYGDGDLRQDNPHVVIIEGYNIQSDEIRKKDPTSIVEFTAGQVGEFRFYCSVPCLGMDNLQKGMLEVNRPKLATSIKTSLSANHLEVHHPNIDHFIPHTDMIHVIAYVTDENGGPVVGALVDFLFSTSFGMMKVASNVTEADGSAHLLYPLVSLRKMSVAAYFRGSGSYVGSNATSALIPDASTVEEPETPYLSGQNMLLDPRLVGVEAHVAATLIAMIAIVVGSVWVMYTYVLTRILKIKMHSSRKIGGGS